jgi:geranylgeranyl pyrophosphate synthase
VTFPLLAVLPALEAVERRRVHAVVEGDETSVEAIAAVIGLVRERGGILATSKMAARYAEHAREALGDLPPTAARDVLDAAIDYVLARDR